MKWGLSFAWSSVGGLAGCSACDSGAPFLPRALGSLSLPLKAWTQQVCIWTEAIPTVIVSFYTSILITGITAGHISNCLVHTSHQFEHLFEKPDSISWVGSHGRFLAEMEVLKIIIPSLSACTTIWTRLYAYYFFPRMQDIAQTISSDTILKVNWIK